MICLETAGGYLNEDPNKLKRSVSIQNFDLPVHLPSSAVLIKNDLIFSSIRGKKADLRVFDDNIIVNAVENYLETPKGQMLIEKKVEEALKENLHDRSTPIYDMCNDIPDEIAETKIKGFLGKLKDEGIEQFDILDIIFEFNLPPEQIERIVNGLLKQD